MVIYPGTLSGGLTEDDMSQLKEVQGKGSGNLENDTEKRSEQRQLILRENRANCFVGTETRLESLRVIELREGTGRKQRV